MAQDIRTDVAAVFRKEFGAAKTSTLVRDAIALLYGLKTPYAEGLANELVIRACLLEGEAEAAANGSLPALRVNADLLRRIREVRA